VGRKTRVGRKKVVSVETKKNLVSNMRRKELQRVGQAKRKRWKE